MNLGALRQASLIVLKVELYAIIEYYKAPIKDFKIGNRKFGV